MATLTVQFDVLSISRLFCTVLSEQKMGHPLVKYKNTVCISVAS